MQLNLTHKDLSIILDALNVCLSEDQTVPSVFREGEYRSIEEKVEEYLESFNVGERNVDEPMMCERCQKKIATRHICQDCLHEYAQAVNEKRLGDS